MKKFVFLSLLILLSSTESYAEKIKVVRNTELLKNTITLRDYDSVKQAFLKDIADVCKAQLNWYHISGKVSLVINNHQVVFYYNSKDILVDSKKFSLSSPTVANKAGIYVPFDFITGSQFAEISDYMVKYDQEKNIFYFDSVTNIASPRVYFENGFTKISIELSEKLKYSIKKSKKEYTIKFDNGKVIPEKIDYKDVFLKQIELKSYYKQAKYVIKVGTGNPNVDIELKENPAQLVVVITPKAEVEPEKTKKNSRVKEENSVETSSIAQVEIEQADKTGQGKNNLVTVVIDAGHGGEDPGCIGVSGTKEKELNLNISQEVARLLREDGYKVILTRNDDRFIPLVNRTEMANKEHADIFVSIHCNAAQYKPDMKGFEIYFLSEKASDSNAEAVAARENAVVKLEKKPSGKQEKLQQLLWSMVRNEFINESSELCSLITTDVISSTELENRGIKQAGFYVLRGAQMPAVLVECGFLTNMKEELKVKSPKFQKKIADSVYSGIKQYIRIKGLALSKANGN